MNATTNELGFDTALSMARQSLYRFAAVSLLDPKAGAWEQLGALRADPLPAEAAALIRGLPESVPGELGLGERPPAELDPARVLHRLPDSPQSLNEQFEDTFGLLVSNACPPYETEYIGNKLAFQRSNALADVSGFYNAFGLSKSEVLPERPDHIALELEFMASLLVLERRAAESMLPERQDRMQVCRDAQAKFLEEHLAWWVPAFAKLLAHENENGFYGAVGVFLSSLIPAERALLGVAAPSTPAAPSPMERPEACEGCELAGP